MKSLADRFWARVSKGSSCWLWKGFIAVSGYGVYSPTKYTKVFAHRLAWELTNGPIPEGLCVLHKCDIRACVNPEHLFLGTRADNAEDRDRKGRLVKRSAPVGELNPNAKLKEEDVLKIRESYTRGGISQEELGRRFGVTQVQISSIVRRIGWTGL